MQPRSWLTARLFLAALFLTLPFGVLAEDEKEAEEDKPKTIADLTEDHQRSDGLFTLFQDPKTGKVHMLIKADQVGQELIYVAQKADGVVQTGSFRGQYFANDIISVQRHFDRIEWVAENTSYYFDPENALSRAAEANISDAVLAVAKIVAEDETNGDMLIEADQLFLTEALQQIKPTADPENESDNLGLGSLDADKSRILNLRSYPQNTDVEVKYVYYEGAPKGDWDGDITDPRSISVRVLHSMIAVPENDYEPRMDDPRVGYFGWQTTDLTSFSPVPYRDVINRWHLVKKDPSQVVSDPVEPITWWIENTTPVEYRDLIRDATLEWNSSFEKAGFSNAVVVKVQPDDAEWDAGDIRYNVLRWTSSPNPPFGGYGPSFSNPRTGQTIGADIMLELSFMNRYLYARSLLADGANLLEADSHALDGGNFCSLGQGLKISNMFASIAAEAAGFDDQMSQQLTHDTMHYLILHEVGHTLGLNHNMKATQLLSAEEAYDPAAVAEKGLAGSVMDYPAVNFAPRDKPQTLFYATRPGPYDDWAIEFGYAPSLQDPQAEAARMQTLLARSTEPQLAFGNDADDMRSPGKAIDPRVNIYDMSGDAVGYASERMELLATTISELVSKLPESGTSYQQTHDAFAVLMREWARSAAVVSRYVGGVYLDRGMSGQDGAGAPYTPVDEAMQKRAMQVLADQVFAADALDPPAELYRYLAQQRRGFNFFSAPEDPKIHDAWLAVQQSVLNHLMHANVLKRLTDTGLYGNDYSVGAFMQDLTNAVFDASNRGDVSSFRRNLQIEYVNRLLRMIDAESKGGFDYTSQSMALYTVNQIRDQLNRKRGTDLETSAHVANLKFLIDQALDTRG